MSLVSKWNAELNQKLIHCRHIWKSSRLIELNVYNQSISDLNMHLWVSPYSTYRLLLSIKLILLYSCTSPHQIIASASYIISHLFNYIVIFHLPHVEVKLNQTKPNQTKSHGERRQERKRNCTPSESLHKILFNTLNAIIIELSIICVHGVPFNLNEWEMLRG